MRLSSPVGFALRRAVDRLGLTKAPNTTVILCGDASCNTFALRFVGSRRRRLRAHQGGRAIARPHRRSRAHRAYPQPLAIHNLNPSHNIPKTLPPLHLHSPVSLRPTLRSPPQDSAWHICTRVREWLWHSKCHNRGAESVRRSHREWVDLVLTISKLKRWSINYYIDTARAAETRQP